MLKSALVGASAVLWLLLSPGKAQAQARQLQITPEGQQATSSHRSVTPLELRQFSQVIKQLQGIEMKTQQKMTAAIKAEGLSPERFVQIEESFRGKPLDPPMTPEEQEKYRKTVPKLQEIWQEAQPRRERAITLQGLTLERFAQINQVVSNDPALQKQVQQMLGQ